MNYTGCSKHTYLLVLLIAVCLYLKFPHHGHGTFWNPLNITQDPLIYNEERYKKYLDDFINKRLNIVSVGEPKVINGFDEVEVLPMHTGWGDDDTMGILKYDMTPELYKKLCPSWEDLDKQLINQTEYTIIEHKNGKWGPYPHGGGHLEQKKMNGSFDDIPKLASLYFNSEFKAANELASKIEEWRTFYTSTFYSDFANRRLTSAMHSGPAAGVAVTCYGNKWWIFSRPRDTAKYGARSIGGASFFRGLDEDAINIVVNTGPGSIITFPPYWGHWVMTDSGRSFMYTLRVLYPGNFALSLLYRLFWERGTFLSMAPTSPIYNAAKKLFGSSGPNPSVYEDIVDSMPDVNNQTHARITKEELDALYDVVESVKRKHLNNL